MHICKAYVGVLSVCAFISLLWGISEQLGELNHILWYTRYRPGWANILLPCIEFLYPGPCQRLLTSIANIIDHYCLVISAPTWLADEDKYLQELCPDRR